MAKPNYSFEKRQRDLAKKRKQEDKRQQKIAAKAAADNPPSDSAGAPGEVDPASKESNSPEA